MITYTTVQSLLGDQRDQILGDFRRLKGNRERWAPIDLRRMAQAITKAEDALEYRANGCWNTHRARLRDVRRSLEVATQSSEPLPRGKVGQTTRPGPRLQTKA